MAGIPEVLFVCTHNAGRSQMAAALLDYEIARRTAMSAHHRQGHVHLLLGAAAQALLC